MRNTSPAIVVIGAGIIGASIAFHLARRDAHVTLIDSGQPGHAVSGASFGWINVTHGHPEADLQLRRAAIDDYRRLERELALAIDWCGALSWHADDGETERVVHSLAAMGHDIRLVERVQIRALEPNLTDPPSLAAYAAGEGVVDPRVLCETLVAGARRAGAHVRCGEQIIGLRTHGRSITGVSTPDGTIDADVVVVAAGTATPTLCAPLGVTLPVVASPALLLDFPVTGRKLRRLLSGPEFEIRQHGTSHLLAAEDDSPGQDVDAIASRTADVIRHSLGDTTGLGIATTRIGMRPIPVDGLPIVGFCTEADGLYVAVMHAGVTLAPVVGRLSAAEILEGADDDALASCRPARFALG